MTCVCVSNGQLLKLKLRLNKYIITLITRVNMRYDEVFHEP